MVGRSTFIALSSFEAVAFSGGNCLDLLLTRNCEHPCGPTSARWYWLSTNWYDAIFSIALNIRCPMESDIHERHKMMNSLCYIGRKCVVSRMIPTFISARIRMYANDHREAFPILPSCNSLSQGHEGARCWVAPGSSGGFCRRGSGGNGVFSDGRTGSSGKHGQEKDTPHGHAGVTVPDPR